jgi:hypothetical protein
MRKVTLVAASAVLFASIPAQAQSLSTYAATCAQELGLATIPGYSCTQGTSVPSNSGFFLSSFNNWLGRVPTANPNVDAVFLCRDTVNGRANLNGYILQNTVTGNTCFFDAREGATSTVPPPTQANANTVWEEPGPPGSLAYNGACQRCHSADPFITSPGLAPAMKTQQMQRMGRNLKGAYNIVNSDVSGSLFTNWNADRQLVSQSGCALTCHNTSNNSGPVAWFNQAQPNGWMPPPANQSFVPSTETPASIAVWRPGTPATFFFDRDGSKSWNGGDQWGAFGTTGDRPVVLKGTDCGAGRQLAEFGVVRGNSWLVTKNNHFYDWADDANTFSFGAPGGSWVSSWNGVAVSVERGLFFIDYNANNATGGDRAFGFGTNGDVPLVGRWKRGIGHRMGIFRQGLFALETNGNNIWDSADTSFWFGDPSDIPFAGDFNGNGIDEIGVFRNGSWFVDMNNNFQWDGPAGGDAEWFFGQAGDIPVVSPTKWNCAW